MGISDLLVCPSVKQADVEAAFMQNYRGAICIAFDDPSWVNADKILIDKHTGGVHAILHESSYFLGHVSSGMAKAFTENREALLSSVRSDGTIYELMVPVHSASCNTQ